MNNNDSFINSLPLVLRVQELANILGVTRSTVYRLIHDNKIKAIRIGRSDYRITRDAFAEYLSAASSEANAAQSDDTSVNPANDPAESSESADNSVNPLLRVEDLMTILGVSRNTAYAIVQSGQIRSVIVSKNRIRITPDALDEYLSHASRYQEDDDGKE